MTRTPVDEAARRRIVEELDRTFFVEAGAGSGKTKSLVDRMIALLKAGRCEIGTLAAVTFTRKAAAELRGRFQIMLERGVAENRLETDVRGRLAQALQNLERCYIGTIHSFCARLLRERPVEIGLDPDFTEMEDIEDALFRDQCWQDYLVKVRIEEEEILRGLDDAGLIPEDLRDAFDTVALYPEVGIAGAKGRTPDYKKYRAALDGFLAVAKKALPEEKPEKGYDALQALIRRCLRRQRVLGFDDHRFLMETYGLLEKERAVTQNRWPTKEAALAFKAGFDEFRLQAAAPALKEWREYRHDKIVRFLRPAISFYESRRKEENKLNYEDLLMQAARLLRDNPEVRRYFSRKYTHVLVDEFQDTDPIQAEVLMYLKGEDVEEREWQKLRPAAGSLFLVGDPKQSIYRFRRADIDIYNCVREMVKAAGGDELDLTSNFRSLKVLADWNNPVFEAVLPKAADRYQARFAPIETVREDAEDCDSGVFKIVVPAVSHHKKADIAEGDAKMIAPWIGWACGGGLRLARSPEETEKGLGPEAQPSDFLVLFREKKNMDIYARALEERGIPFEISGSDAFSESDKIREIRNLASALDDPDNPVYTVAVLRGIFFGVSDADLAEFHREGGVFNFLTPGREILQSQHLGALNVSLALQRMKAWREITLRLPASAALHRIIEESGILNYLASIDMGSSRVGNLLKLLEIVRHEESRGATSFSGVVKLLEELAEVREIEEISLTPARANAVRLMNLHKAKGLEAPVVFLANPGPLTEHAIDKHVVRVSEGDGRGSPKGYFVFSRRGAYGRSETVFSQPEGWAVAEEEEKRYQAAERVRLMYVAATRARNLLIVSTYAGGAKFKPWMTIDDGLAGVHELGEAFPGSLPRAVDDEAGRAGEAAAEPDQSPAIGLRQREKAAISKAEAQRARKEIAANIGRSASPTYAVESVTALARRERFGGEKAGGVKRDREEKDKNRDKAGSGMGPALAGNRGSGTGLIWGRIVHQILEAIGSGRLKLTPVTVIASGAKPSQVQTERHPVPAVPGMLGAEDRARLALFLENILAAEESDFAWKEELLAHIESILRSPFWARVMKSGKRYFEIPFAIKTDRATLTAVGAREATPDVPVILRGTIDLVFREEQDGGQGGWVIADYKTDKIAIARAVLEASGWALDLEKARAVSPEFAAVIDAYVPQVRLYGRFWQQITGETVSEAGLYFTSIDRWVRVLLPH